MASPVPPPEETRAADASPAPPDPAAPPGAERGSGAGELIRGALRRVYWPLALLVAVGVALRLTLQVAYRPMAQIMADSLAYMGMAQGGLFQDPGRPSGYPVFLRVMHGLSDSLATTIFVQHALGVAAGLLCYAIARRLGVCRPLSLIPAALVLLSGDQILLEHTLLTEAVFTFLLVLALYAAVRTITAEGRAPLAWAAGTGLALGSALTVRTAILFLLPAVVVWALFAVPAPVRRRLVVGGLLVAGMAGAVVPYLAAQNAEVGTWSLSRSPGWALYARVAAFADCSEFTPPAGTEALCETTPNSQRNGPDFYAWEGGPARALYGGAPNGGEQLSEFAKAAILGEPTDYVETVGQDFMRYFIHDFGVLRSYGGVGFELMEIDRRAPGLEETLTTAIGSWYEPTTLDIDTGTVSRLADLQDSVLRVHGKLFLVLFLLGVAAIVVCTGTARSGAALMVITTLALLLIPVATAIYSQRYAVPAAGPVGVAAVLGIAGLAERSRTVRARFRTVPAPASETAP